MKSKPQIYEVAYEVCNKVGGIYTVLESKAQEMVNNYGENYCAVGFFDKVNSGIEFDSGEPPQNIKKIFDELEKFGIKCYYGTWLISGRPKTILVDAVNFAKETNRVKGELWNLYDVDSLRSGVEFNEPVLWAYACGMLIEKLTKDSDSKESVSIAHFHEWMSGAGLLYLKNAKKNNNLKIATVFTTHATILGRTMAGAGERLQEIVRESIEKSETVSLDVARKYGILDKHTIEKACAQESDIFTTVSDLTSREAQYILGRKAEVILPNGLNMDRFLTIDDLTVMKRTHRKQMQKFLTAYFLRYYDIDLKNIRSMFISGRYEFHNKGIDLFIEALGKLNEKLRKEKSEGKKNKIAISFIFVPTKTWGENIEVLKNKSLYSEMENRIEDELENIKEGILNLLTKVKVPYNVKEILGDEFVQKCRKMAMHFAEKRGEMPPLCAFDLAYPEYNDSVMNALRRNGLNNHETDQVKVIFYPAYLSSADRLIGLDYTDATITFDLGVFPSYYESWGYTPLEAVAQGIPAVTTDLSGYGKFVNNLKEEGVISDGGVYVLKREGIIWENIVNDLASEMYKLVVMEKKDLSKLRRSAKEIAYFADWKILIKYYIEAHNLALEKVK